MKIGRLRFEYISRLFCMVDNFLEAQRLFVSMLFYRGRSQVYLVYQPVEKPLYYWSRNSIYVATPFKKDTDFNKENIFSFLKACSELYFMSMQISDMDAFIGGIVDAICACRQKGTKGEFGNLLARQQEIEL